MNDEQAGNLSRLLTDMSVQSAEIRKGQGRIEQGQGRIERMLAEILAKLTVLSVPVVEIEHKGKIGA